jgi:hypothetical protein
MKPESKEPRPAARGSVSMVAFQIAGRSELRKYFKMAPNQEVPS